MAVLHKIMIALSVVYVVVVVFCLVQVFIKLPDDVDFCKNYASVLVQSDTYALCLCFTVMTIAITRKISD